MSVFEYEVNRPMGRQQLLFFQQYVRFRGKIATSLSVHANRDLLRRSRTIYACHLKHRSLPLQLRGSSLLCHRIETCGRMTFMDDPARPSSSQKRSCCFFPITSSRQPVSTQHPRKIFPLARNTSLELASHK
jgi:hypothetical protein